MCIFKIIDDQKNKLAQELGHIQFVVSPTIFNIVIDAVVRSNFLEIYFAQEAHHGLWLAVGEQDIVFYAEDDRISGRNHIWVQGMLFTLVWMFERFGL